jgi:hypothetical protein
MYSRCYAIDEYIMMLRNTVSRQQIGKHIPAATDTHITIALLFYSARPNWL